MSTKSQSKPKAATFIEQPMTSQGLEFLEKAYPEITPLKSRLLELYK